jgi:hypothetical protein
VLIFYADENGGHSMATKPDIEPPELTNGTSPRFTISCVGVRDTSRKPLAEAIFTLKTKHFGEAIEGPWGDTEIKGRFLMRAARGAASGNPLIKPSGWKALDTVEKVQALAIDLGLLFGKFRPLIFAAVIDKNEMLATGRDLHPIGVAYAYLHQRIAFAMEDTYAGDAAMVVADQQTQHESFFRSGGLHEARESLTRRLPRKPNYDLVLDKPLWVDTDFSSWDREIIQLADIVAYTVNACVERGAPPAEYSYLWEQIKPHFATHYKTGKIAGAGISIYPRTSTLPDI